ncbi:MAG: efflux RND transporter permease subunit, partial [Candidatus Thiodiazotropha sp.]
IGWIALAGIIVRNSILLVDFSIHQVQQGTSVVDSVIMACKTRTRPIMITAFALVCGSSVIFFDPIFQGMAISLASGVLVSTVLTLIVIPLGCIAASKDIMEVAATTAPAGSSPDEDSEKKPAEAIPAVAHTQASPEAKSEVVKNDSLPIRIWQKVIAVVTMLFYLIRAIFLVIGQMFKGLFRKGKAPQLPDAQPGVKKGGGTAGGSGSGGATTPQTGSPSSASEDVPVAAAPATTTDKASQRPKEKVAAPSKVSVDTPGDQSAEDPKPRKQATKADAVGKQKKSVKKKQVKLAEKGKGRTKGDSRKQATSNPKQKKRPSTLKKQAAKKKAASAKTKGNGSPGSGTQQTKTVPKPASNVTEFPIRKRAARRGIRLK